MKTTLLLIRHGQSLGNVMGRFTGSGDLELSELGKKQAEYLSDFLGEGAYRPDVIFSSPLKRSVETAGPTARKLNLPIGILPDLREIRGGEWEGMTFEEIAERYPERHNVWKTRFFEGHPNGGESVREVYERAEKAIDGVLEQYPGKTVALFTHATVSRLMGCRWMGRDFSEIAALPWSGNASTICAVFEGTRFDHLEFFGRDDYLGGMTTVFAEGKI